MAYIYLLSKNYVNASDAINVSSGALTKARIYDQRYDLLWQSSGETDESGFNTYIEAVFYQGSNLINRTYDTIILQGINLKQFKLQNYSGGAYADISGASYTNNADSSVRIKLASPITGSKIKLLMQSTIVANQEKSVGEFWCALESICLQQVASSRNRGDYFRGGDFYLANGSLRSFTIFSKANFTFNFQNISDADFITLKSIYDQHLVMTFYPNYERNINEIFLVQWVGAFRGTMHPKIKINSIEVNLKEQ